MLAGNLRYEDTFRMVWPNCRNDSKYVIILNINLFMPTWPFYFNSLDKSISYNKASDLSLHCLPMSLLWDARLKWVKRNRCTFRVGTSVQCPTFLKHYENMPIQIYRKFHLQKTENFQIKNSDSFNISAHNIDCGYSLEPPHRGGSNEYRQSMFLSRNKKNNVYPYKPQFYYIKVGFKGVKII